MKKSKRPIVKTRNTASARAALVARKPRQRKRSLLHFDKAFEALNEGFYDWNVKDGSTYYSDRVLRAVGLSRKQLSTAADWHKRVHPEDRPAYDAALAAHFKAQTDRFECDFRFRASDDTWRWARQHGIAMRDARGRAVRMIGSTGDITEWKRMEQALRESQQRYELTTSAALEGIYEWDLARNDLYLSERWKQFLGLPEGAHTPAAWNERVHREDFPAYRQAVIDCIKGNTPRLEIEYRLRHRNGWLWILDHAVAVRDAKGRATKLVGAVSDIDRRKQAEFELRRARDDATAALERQTATAEILKVMASSPSDVQPVFEAIASGATRLCNASFCVVFRFDGTHISVAAEDGRSPGTLDIIRAAYPAAPGKRSFSARAILERRVISIADAQDMPEEPLQAERARAIGYRSILVVPMMKGDQAIGSINVARLTVHPFTDVEIELLRTFADQAVIAIENVRLFNETKEALERQTATAEILKVIASSPTDVQPVFDVIVERAVKLCGARFGRVYRYDGSLIHMVAGHGLSTSGVATVQRVFPRPATDDTIVGRVILARQPYFLADIERDTTVPELSRQMIEALNTRSQVTIPMLRSGEPIGAITMGWDQPEAFDDRQVTLLQTFADQAVIAIENVRLFNETKEGLERQTATAEILGVISSSPTDTQPVFDTIASNAVRLCESDNVAVFRVEGSVLRMVAESGPAAKARRVGDTMELTRASVSGRAVLECRTIHIHDLTAELDAEWHEAKAVQRVIGHRTALAVPLMREGAAIGVIFTRRMEVRPFSDKQVALLKTFADQAVIAIENVRLFNETKEALERQTATAEILKVIASSPADVQPVFDAIVASAARLFGRRAALRIVEAGGTRRRARSEAAPADSPDLLPIDEDSLAGRVILHATAMQVVDTLGPDAPPYAQANARKWDFRANAAAPLIRDGKAIGSISVASPVPGAMSDKQMALLATFADQAVIAIENVRLFNETKEALDQQTATAGILGVISSSPTSVQPVFESILEHALRLCEASFGYVSTSDGNAFDLAVQRGLEDPVRAEAVKAFHETRVAGPSTALGRLRETKRSVHILDAKEEAAYRARDPRRVAIVELAGARTMLAMPLLREGDVIGAVVVYRREVKAFTDKQTDLLRTFAAQAVIAIENVRLFNETREALERQTATAEVLRVISNSPTDTQPVFEAIAQSGLRLFPGAAVAVALPEGDQVRATAIATEDPELAVAWRARFPVPLARHQMHGAAILDRRLIDVPDAEAEVDGPMGPGVRNFLASGNKAITIVPMIRGDSAIGTISVIRLVAGPLKPNQIALLQTFADQAVIAIENVRLFNQTKESLERQTATAEILGVISSSPTDVQPVYDAIVKSALRLIAGVSAAVTRVVGDSLHLAALTSTSESGDEALRRMFPRPVDGVLGKAVHTGIPASRLDIETDPDISPESREMARARGYRSMLVAPLMSEGIAIGTISVTRREPGAFSDHQIGLLKTFANQAVIAVQNVRLFNETKEALERQTATAEILGVIAGSPSDVQPVFDAIVQTAIRLVPPWNAAIDMRDGDVIRMRAAASPRVAQVSVTRFAEFFPMPFDPETNEIARCIAESRIVESADSQAPGVNELLRKLATAGRYRSAVLVPLVHKATGIGAIGLTHPEPNKRLSDKQMELISTFANQAVIAIENVRLFNETKEALERQTATAEILKVIASSPSDVQPVFDAIVRSAQRLLAAHSATALRRIDDVVHRAASTIPPDAETTTAFPRPFAVMMSTNPAAARVWTEGVVWHVTDTESDRHITESGRRLAQTRGYRSQVWVPMQRDRDVVGVLSVQRQMPGGFRDGDIALLKTFADQAAIAIENVRLFSETKEALERQTATSEVLNVIARSPSDVQPVLDAVAESAARLCGASDALIMTSEAGMLVRRAHFGPIQSVSAARPLTRGTPTGRAVLERCTVHVEDVLTEIERGDYLEAAELQRRNGMRTILSVPLVREDSVIGVISMRRLEVRPFTEKQISLVKTFADQAVIAIENVRLFNETKEALERQTATAEILRVIASSPSDVQPVFDQILHSCQRLFEGLQIGLTLAGEDGMIHLGAYQGENREHLEQVYPYPLGRDSGSGQAMLDRKVVQFADIGAPGSDAPPRVLQGAQAAGVKSLIFAPLIAEGRSIGALWVGRCLPGPFGDDQAALLKTFADQAVIAIENVRLFKELQQRTEALTKSVSQLTALGEVGQAISSTLDLETVLKTIAARAVQLTGLDGASIYEYDEQREEFRLQVAENLDEALLQTIRKAPIRKGDGTVGGVAITLEPTQVPDIMDPGYRSSRKELLIRAGYRAVLTVPLLREDHIIGALSVSRKSSGPFAPEIVELLKTFATQSAMAIQNARLFREIAEKGKQLEEASKHKSQFLASMSHELRTPLNAILGFNEMLLGEIYGEVPADMKEPLADIQSSGKHLLRLINNVLDLAKIEAGRMELALADYSVQDTVESVRSTLRPLAAEKGLEFVASVPGDVPLAFGDGGRLTQCLMNLAGNSLKFTRQGRVEIAVEVNDGLLRYRVSDTGIGIPPDKIASLFTEFKQTDATIASEFGGTGLGLSITKKFVEMHRGRIWVESEPGKGSQFFIEIPLRLDEGASA